MTYREALVDDLGRARRKLSAVENRLDDLQGRAPTNSEMRDLVAVQVQYDDLYRGIECGGSPPPLKGESKTTYAARLVAGLQPFSEQHRKIDVHNLARLDSTAFEAVSDAICRDVQKVIDDPTVPSFRHGPDVLREVKVRDSSGREASEFRGRPLVWLSHFMSPVQQCVTGVFDPRSGRQLK